jgi:peptide/nickel transport system permease protein
MGSGGLDATARSTSAARGMSAPMSVRMSSGRQRGGLAHRFTQNRSVTWGGGIVLVTVLTAILAPLITPHDPYASSLLARLAPPAWEGGSPTYFLGTDQLGRDLFSRLVFGTRVSLIVGVLSVIAAGAVGLILGIVAGYYGGSTDKVIMLVTDVMLAFPMVLLALAIVALLGSNLTNLIIVFTVTNWFVYARMSRGATLELRNREFVAASHASGASDLRILYRHLLPNVLGPIIVIASFGIAQIITTEAALGFLGLGVPPPVPSWGSMLADGRDYLETAWWVSVFPGVALMMMVLGFNFLGNGLRDLLDPRSRS